jgi:hypothetical protein
MDENIGRLTPVPLRDLWAHEERNFSVWLENNLDVLADCVGITLNPGEREKSLGDFKIDLVAEDDDHNAVIIENQLEQTNHDHLGKLITYLTNMDAKTAIWITKEPRPEHTKAIAWLNQTEVSFYLVKLEAFKIGNSSPAPKFTLIQGPSEITREVGEAKRGFSDRHRLRIKFWAQLLKLAKDQGVKTHENRNPTPDVGLSGPSGIRDLRFVYLIWSKEKAAVELYIHSVEQRRNKEIYDQLFKEKERIEQAVGFPLSWERLTDQRTSKLRYYIKLGGLQDVNENWEPIQTKMIN